MELSISPFRAAALHIHAAGEGVFYCFAKRNRRHCTAEGLRGVVAGQVHSYAYRHIEQMGLAIVGHGYCHTLTAVQGSVGGAYQRRHSGIEILVGAVDLNGFTSPSAIAVIVKV